MVAWAAVANWREVETRIDFTDGSARPEGLTRFDGWRLTPEGLSAPSGEKCVLCLTGWKSRYQDLLLDVETTETGRGNVQLAMLLPPDAKPAEDTVPKAEARGAPWQLRFGVPWRDRSATSLVGPPDGVNLTRLWPASGPFLLFLTPAKGVSGPLVRALTFRRRIGSLPLLLLPFFLVTVCVCVWHLAQAFPKCSPQKVTGLAAAALALMAWFGVAGVLEAMFPVALCLAAMAFVPIMLRRGRAPEVTPILLALLTFAAASLRWDYLNEMRFQTPAPDAVGYRDLARAMTLFYDSQVREPLYILFVKVGLAVLGDGDTQVRIVSYLFSVLLIPVLYKVGHGLFDRATGLIGATILAANSAWASNGALGLRLEVFTIAILILTWAIFTPRPPGLRRHAIWLGLASTCVCLVRLTSLWFCLIGTAYALYRRGWNTRAFLLAAMITFLPVAPYLVYCSAKYGDPLHALNVHVKHFRNQEVASQSGSSVREEIAKDPYGGPETNAVRYFFSRHSPRELLERTVRAFYQIFLGSQGRRALADDNRVLYWWVLCSFLPVLFSRRRLLLVWVALLVGPIAWLYGEDFGPELRHVMQVSVLVYLFMGDLLVRAIRHFLPSEEQDVKAHVPAGNP